MRFLSASSNILVLFIPKRQLILRGTGNLSQSGSGQHLQQMLRDKLGHLEHTYLAFAIEHRPE